MCGRYRLSRHKELIEECFETGAAIDHCNRMRDNGGRHWAKVMSKMSTL